MAACQKLGVPRFALVAKFAAPAAVAFGGIHAATGATTEVKPILNSKNPANAKVGQSFLWTFDTSVETAKTYSFTGDFPPGVSWSGRVSSGVSTLRGAPTLAGTYKLSIVGWRERTAGSGEKTPVYNLTIIVEPGEVIPAGPKITAQPVGGEFEVDSALTLKVAAAGGVIRYQWRKDGQDIIGGTAPELKIGKLSFSDAGVYSVVLSDSTGTVVSDNAVVQVVGGYQPWRARFWKGPELLDDKISGPLADGDGDGARNLLEFVYGADPTKPDAAKHPRVEKTILEGQPFLSVAVPRQAEASSVEVFFEKSTSLKANAWTPLADGGEIHISTRDESVSLLAPLNEPTVLVRVGARLKPPGNP